MRKDFWMAVAALLGLSLVVFWGKSYETTLRGIDSNIHASIAMNVTSNQFAPRLPMPYIAGGDSLPYFNDHPFFYFWLNGKVMRALGPAAWTARLLSAFFSVGCVLLILTFGSILVSRAYGFFASLIFLFTRDIILTGSTMTLDMPLLFFILLTFILWKKRKWISTGIVAGIGLWIKTPVVLLIYPCAFVLNKEKPSFQKIFLSATIALGIGSLVWIITGWIGGWNLVTDYWSRQVWGTAIGGRNFSETRNWLSFFEMVKRGFLPGLPFLIFGIIQIFWKRLWKLEVVQISLTAIGVLVVVITLMKFKYDYYYNPTFPFLSLIAALSFKEWIEAKEQWLYQGLTAVTPILLAVLLCTPVSFGEEAFVALRRFEPLIQSYGNCSDPILLVPGGEPIGSQLDYRLHLAFYTGHTPIQTPCETLDLQIENRAKRKPIGWLILSEENFAHCLNESNRKQFPTGFRVGSQYLLTDIIPKSDMTNLTPLEREGRAAQDCHAPPYPQDRYHLYQAEDR